MACQAHEGGEDGVGHEGREGGIGGWQPKSGWMTLVDLDIPGATPPDYVPLKLQRCNEIARDLRQARG